MSELKPYGEPVSLIECPPGPFSFNGSLGFKTEYGMTLVDENGANMRGDLIRWKVTQWPDAYCMESGETFWGGTKTHQDRAALIVQPVEVASPAPTNDGEGLIEDHSPALKRMMAFAERQIRDADNQRRWAEERLADPKCDELNRAYYQAEVTRTTKRAAYFAEDVAALLAALNQGAGR